MSEFEFARDGLSAEEAARLKGSLVRASDLVVRIPDVVDIEGSSYARIPKIGRDRPAPPLEEYVAEMKEAARKVGESMMARRLTEASTEKERKSALEDIEFRVADAERYARWRWQGYKNAEIASL
jgi:hypothetical protein